MSYDTFESFNLSKLLKNHVCKISMNIIVTYQITNQVKKVGFLFETRKIYSNLRFLNLNKSFIVF